MRTQKALRVSVDRGDSRVATPPGHDERIWASWRERGVEGEFPRSVSFHSVSIGIPAQLRGGIPLYLLEVHCARLQRPLGSGLSDGKWLHQTVVPNWIKE